MPVPLPSFGDCLALRDTAAEEDYFSYSIDRVLYNGPDVGKWCRERMPLFVRRVEKALRKRFSIKSHCVAKSRPSALAEAIEIRGNGIYLGMTRAHSIISRNEGNGR